jgi:hypothetical protein
MQDAVQAALTLGGGCRYTRYEPLYRYERYYAYARIPGRLATAS